MQRRREVDRKEGLPPRLFLVVSATVAALLLLVVAGCGGDERLSKEEYGEKVSSVYGGVRQAFRAAGQSTNSPDLAERVEDARNELEDAADELDGVEPPREVLELHQELVLGLRGFASDLEKLQEAVEAGNREALIEFNQGVATNPSVLRIAEAAEEMVGRGYDLGELDPEG